MKQMTLLLVTGCLALGTAIGASAATSPRSADSPEVEYLRRLIAEQQKHPDKVIRSLPTNAPAPARTETTKQPEPVPAKAESPKAAPPARAKENPDAPTPAEVERQKKISEVEARLDEMLKLKEAREKAALTNAASTNKVAAAPQTKRQRLDALLKQMIDGTITGAEYTERRAKIVAEPD
jgi:hypothetical protein